MISYDDLERALARWKARAQSGAAITEAAPADGGDAGGGDAGSETPPPPIREGLNGRSRASSELSGEIDLNELVEE